MPRELAFMDVYFPTVTALFLLSLLLMWLLDRLLAYLGTYRYVWHPALLRVSLFVCIFGSTALFVYT